MYGVLHRRSVLGVGAREYSGDGAREYSGNGGRKLCPLTSTPSSREWCLGTTDDNDWKGIASKSANRMRRGAPGYLRWKSATCSGAWASSASSQELCSIPYPSHLIKYRNLRLMTLLSRISSTMNSFSPLMISGSGGGGGHHPGIVMNALFSFFLTHRTSYYLHHFLMLLFCLMAFFLRFLFALWPFLYLALTRFRESHL